MLSTSVEEVHDYGNRVIMSYRLLLVCKRLTPLVIIIASGIIKARTTCYFFRRAATPQSVQAQWGVGNALEASSNTTSVRLPEGCDHPRGRISTMTQLVQSLVERLAQLPEHVQNRLAKHFLQEVEEA